jgi:hypothetical protein
MQYSDFKRHLGKAGLTINQFSELIEVRPSSISALRSKPTVPAKYSVLAVLLGDNKDRQVDSKAILGRFGIRWPDRKDAGNVAVLDEFRDRPKA